MMLSLKAAIIGEAAGQGRVSANGSQGMTGRLPEARLLQR
jgi:hypothetical protein